MFNDHIQKHWRENKMKIIINNDKYEKILNI